MAVNRLEITELDFDSIKTNLKSFLKQQSEFSDYDFEGSGLNVLLDILAYNTHYNAYYLNMVANEAFLDTALLRDSVISHAKKLGYTPYSSTSPKAICNITVASSGTSPEKLTMPRGFSFTGNPIDNSVYSFIVLDDVTVTKSNSNYYFENLEIYEGKFVSYEFTHDESSNPKQIFVLPDPNLDTRTIKVTSRPSNSNTQISIYSKVVDILDINSQSEVYFLEESRGGKYQIYFGDNVIGKKLEDGSVITVSYLVTNGSLGNGTNDFIPSQPLQGLANFTVDVVNVASGGGDRESLDEIRFSSTTQYTTQNRLVTFKDYESYIKKNYPVIDSISVWGGEDETPRVYGKVLISIKPKDGYYISENEKQNIIENIIKPKSIVSVQTEILDPDYLYILTNAYVKYDSRKTIDSEDTIKTKIKNAILTYSDNNLNVFGARFVLSKLQDDVDATNLNSIIGSEINVRVQKRFLPVLNTNKSYSIKFNTPLHRGTISNKLASTTFNVLDSNGVERTVYFDEILESYSGVSSIIINDPGVGYTSTPTVTIVGDGLGAEAEAVIVNGRIQNINITKRGIDYTRAIVTISGGGGYGASASAVIDARTGVLRTIYYDSNAQRQVIDESAGLIDYNTGTIDIFDINILSVTSPDNYIRISAESEMGIIESKRNSIITIDPNDSAAISVELVKI